MAFKLYQLTQSQKDEMQSLMKDYFDRANENGISKTGPKFVYLQKMAREGYAYAKTLSNTDVNVPTLDGCQNSAHDYYMNGATFAQMIWMGRALEDFTSTAKTTITSCYKEMNGYYFDFLEAQNAFGVKKSNGFYTANSYVDDKSTRRFLTFDDASAMASELYRKGYEIPYAKADVGDLVFYRSTSMVDDTRDNREAKSFRNIDHVGIVFERNDDSHSVTIIECHGGYTNKIGRCCISKTAGEVNPTRYALVRGAGLNYRVAMCARHPAAFGHPDNVPAAFTSYRRDV